MSRALVVVDQIFASVEGAYNQSLLQDFILSTVFANAAARASRNAAAESANDAFRNEWSSALGQLGWVVSSAGVTQLSSYSGRSVTTLARNIDAAISSPAIAGALDALEGLTQSKDTDAAKLTDMWWRAGAQADPFYASIAVVDLTGDNPVGEFAQFTVDMNALEIKDDGILLPSDKPLDPTSAKALFTEVLARSIRMTNYQIKAELQLEQFQSQRSTLIDRLGSKVFDHFETQPLGLYGDPS